MEFLSTFVLAVSITGGAIPSYNFGVTDTDGHIIGASVVSETRYFTDLNLEIQGFDNLFFVGYSVRTEAVKSAISWGFAPRDDLYVVDAGVRLAGFELGWWHQCQHPVEASALPHTIADNRMGGYDAVYLRYKASFKMFQ